MKRHKPRQKTSDHTPAVGRDACGHWRKGYTPNPGGRPKREVEVRALAQQHGPEAIAGLVAIAANRKYQPTARVMAWREILDRGYGRAPMYVDVTHHVRPDLSRLDEAELAQLEAMLAKATPRALPEPMQCF